MLYTEEMEGISETFDCVNKHSSGNISFLILFLNFQMVFILGSGYLFTILPKEGNKLKS